MTSRRRRTMGFRGKPSLALAVSGLVKRTRCGFVVQVELRTKNGNSPAGGGEREGERERGRERQRWKEEEAQ